MDFLSGMLNYFRDPTIKRRNKLILPICALIIIVFLNDITGYSFYYSRGKKVEQVSRITEVLNDTIPDILAYEMIRLREEILERRSEASRLLKASADNAGNADKNYLRSSIRNKAEANLIAQQNTRIIPKASNAATPLYAKDSTIISTQEAPDTLKNAIKSMMKIDPHNAENNIDRALFFACSSGIYFLLFMLACFYIFTGNILEYDETAKKYVDNRGLNTLPSKLITCAIALASSALLSLLSYIVLGSVFLLPVLGKWWITYAIVCMSSLLLPLFLFYPVIFSSHMSKTETRRHGALLYESYLKENKQDVDEV